MSTTTRTTLIDPNQNSKPNVSQWFTAGTGDNSNLSYPSVKLPHNHRSPYPSPYCYDPYSGSIPNLIQSTTTTTAAAVDGTGTHSGTWAIHLCGVPIQFRSQLCLLIGGLSVMVSLNAILLVWIITFINLSNIKIDQNVDHLSSSARSDSSPLEQIDIFGGLLVKGKLEVGSIESPSNRLFRLQSSDSIVFGPSRPYPRGQNLPDSTTAWLRMGLNRIVAYAHSLVIRSSLNDNLLLLVQSDPNDESNNLGGNSSKSTTNAHYRRTIVGVDSLKIAGSSGLNLNSSIQVPTLNSDQSLLVWSPNRQVLVRGPKGIDIRLPPNSVSKSATIDSERSISNQYPNSDFTTFHASSRFFVHLRSRSGKIVLDGSTVSFSSRLATVHPSQRGKTYPTIGQVCVCARSGRLFMSPSHHPTGCLIAAQIECPTSTATSGGEKF